MKDDQNCFIDIEQLRVGLYVHLDLGWMDHPFPFSNFKIKTEDQIATIKSLGLKIVRCSPLRSDCGPLPAPARVTKTSTPSTPSPASATEPAPSTFTSGLAAANEASAPTTSSPEPDTAVQTQRRQIERLHQLRRAIDKSEKKFLVATDTTRRATRQIHSQPQAAIQQAETLINGILDSMLMEGDIAIHAINGNRSGDDSYSHALNVTVLGLILAKSLDVTTQDLSHLGMAALFHDIGKSEIPNVILMKSDPLTKPEQSYLEQHSEFGARIAKKSGMPERVADIILQHHECADGSGYPSRLKETQIDPLARLLAIVNTYDNLCNPINPANAMTPYETLAHMFANQRSKFDAPLLNLLIKSLGVYPPGSVVQLSSGMHAIVISVNPNRPLRPFVMAHNPRISQEEPLIINLCEEPNLNITKCLLPSQLPPKVLKYLNPRKRVSYFVDADPIYGQLAS